MEEEAIPKTSLMWSEAISKAIVEGFAYAYELFRAVSPLALILTIVGEAYLTSQGFQTYIKGSYIFLGIVFTPNRIGWILSFIIAAACTAMFEAHHNGKASWGLFVAIPMTVAGALAAVAGWGDNLKSGNYPAAWIFPIHTSDPVVWLIVLATVGIALSNDYFYAQTVETVSQPKKPSKHDSIESVRAGVLFVVRLVNSAIKILQTVLGFGSMLLMDVMLSSAAFGTRMSPVGAQVLGAILWVGQVGFWMALKRRVASNWMVIFPVYVNIIDTASDILAICWLATGTVGWWPYVKTVVNAAGKYEVVKVEHWYQVDPLYFCLLVVAGMAACLNEALVDTFFSVFDVKVEKEEEESQESDSEKPPKQVEAESTDDSSTKIPEPDFTPLKGISVYYKLDAETVDKARQRVKGDQLKVGHVVRLTVNKKSMSGLVCKISDNQVRFLELREEQIVLSPYYTTDYGPDLIYPRVVKVKVEV